MGFDFVIIIWIPFSINCFKQRERDEAYRAKMSKNHEPVVGVPLYVGNNPYQAGQIPPNAIFGDPHGVPIQQTMYRDTPAPFNCVYCGNSGLTTIRSLFYLLSSLISSFLLIWFFNFCVWLFSFPIFVRCLGIPSFNLLLIDLWNSGTVFDHWYFGFRLLKHVFDWSIINGTSFPFLSLT